MAHVLVRHKVSSYEDWKKVFDNFEKTRKASGELSYHVLQNAENGNNLTVMFEWDNLDKARSFMESPTLQEEMQKAGVTEAPEINFLNETDKGSF